MIAIQKKYKTRLLGLGLLLLVLIPVNILYVGTNFKDSNGTEHELEEDQNSEDNQNNRISAMKAIDSEITFMINDTIMYENGTFYCYIMDYLNFTVQNHTYIEKNQVKITIDGSAEGDQDLTYKDGLNISTITTQFDDDSAGTYECTLTYKNSTGDIKDFYFSIKLNNPAPVITGAWIWDDTYNPSWEPLAEGGIVSTYRETTLYLKVDTINKDDVTEKLVFNYTDGFREISKEITDKSTSGNERSFNSKTNDEGIIIKVNTTSGFEDAWKPRQNMYKVVLNASASGDDYDYLFDFYLEVSNKPPQITMFDFPNGAHEETPDMSKNKYNITMKINATDLEDDLLYFRGDSGERTAIYPSVIGSIEIQSGCEIISPSSPTSANSLKLLSDDNTNTYYDLNYTKNAGGDFIITMNVDPEINYSYIDAFKSGIVLTDNKTDNYDASPYEAYLYIYDFVGSTWDDWINLSQDVIKDADSTLFNKSTEVSKYISENEGIKFRIEYNDDQKDVRVLLKEFNLTLNITRRDSFSSIQVSVVKPTERLPSDPVEIINHWNENEDVWYYTYELVNDPLYYGSYTFILDVQDHGSQAYADVFVEDGESSSDDFIGRAVGTKIFCFGQASSETFNVSSIPQIYTDDVDVKLHTAPLRDETFNVSIELEGIDTTYKGGTTYTKYKVGSGLVLQKNETSTNSTGLGGFGITPDYNVTNTESNVTADDGNVFEINMTQNHQPGEWHFDSVKWTTTLENKWWIDKNNITQIHVNIDNWFNSTSGLTIYFEFWNFTSEKWVLLSGCTDGNLKDTADDTNFEKIVNSPTELEDIIESYYDVNAEDYRSIVNMRIRIEKLAAYQTKDYLISIDYIGLDYTCKNNYTAELTLSRKLNTGVGETFDLVPYRTGATTMRYSAEINVKDLGLYAENFVLSFRFQNGNSSLYYTYYRMISRVFRNDIDSLSIKRLHYYDKEEEINYLGANFTIHVRNPVISCPADFTLNRKSSGMSIESVFFTRNRDQINLTGTLNLQTLKDNETNTHLDLQVQFKYGTEYMSDSGAWIHDNEADTGSTFTYDFTNKKWSFIKTIDSEFNVGVYFCRLYLRNQYGEENFTAWKVVRVQNFQPIDFQFEFYDETLIKIDRSETYSFDFSFLDYDMTTSDATSDPQLISGLLEIRDKSNVLKKINSTDYTFKSKTGNRLLFEVDIFIPSWVKTGPYNETYIEWTLMVNDTGSEMQEQIAVLHYNKTKFVISNNAPTVYAFSTDKSNDRVYRNQNVNFRFKIADPDEVKPNNLEIINLNITDSGSTIRNTLDNDTVGLDNSYRNFSRIITSSDLVGTWVVDVKLNDSDHRIAKYSFTFQVLNNIPVILEYGITPNETKRNTGVGVTFKLNASDVEDTYLGDKKCTGAWVYLRHRGYSEKIRTVSSNIEPYIFNLSGRAGVNKEIWNRTVEFKTTMAGERFFAGNLSVVLNITDSDGATTQINATDLIILNNAPGFTSAKIESLGMTEEDVSYVSDTVVRKKAIDFYLFASDVEGLSSILLSYIEIDPENREIYNSKTFDESNWIYYADYKNTSISLYKLPLNTSKDIREGTVKIEIDDVYIFDTDHGYKSETLYGRTSNYYDFSGITITILEKEEGPDLSSFVLIGTIVGISAIGVITVLGILYWRKKSGWKRFMD